MSGLVKGVVSRAHRPLGSLRNIFLQLIGDTALCNWNLIMKELDMVFNRFGLH